MYFGSLVSGDNIVYKRYTLPILVACNIVAVMEEESAEVVVVMQSRRMVGKWENSVWQHVDR